MIVGYDRYRFGEILKEIQVVVLCQDVEELCSVHTLQYGLLCDDPP